MKQDDELWLKKMKEVLDDYSEPAPRGGWERLEQSLAPVPKRRALHTRWWMAAAAAVVLAVSGISFYFLHTPMAHEVRVAMTPLIDTNPDKEPTAPQADVTARIEPVNETPAQHRATTHVSGTASRKPVTETLPRDEQAALYNNVSAEGAMVSNAALPEKSATETVSHTTTTRPENEKKQTALPAVNEEVYLLSDAKSKRSADRRMSFTLAVNSGAGTKSDNNAAPPMSQMSLIPQFAAPQTGGSFEDNAILELDNKQGLYFKEGVPYLHAPVKYKHRQPVAVGASVRKGLGNGFSLETGLTYTYLASDIHGSDEENKKLGTQVLHYLGIPLRANWNFVNTSKFTLYLAGGGMVEKCVYGKTDGETNTVKPLQFSLAAGVGAQYNVSKLLGIYAEPGVAYYFDDGSDVETIRKEKPFNLNLQVGMRFTY